MKAQVYIFLGVVELIETLWNVNVPEACTAGRGEIELIETLWNVNRR